MKMTDRFEPKIEKGIPVPRGPRKYLFLENMQPGDSVLLPGSCRETGSLAYKAYCTVQNRKVRAITKGDKPKVFTIREIDDKYSRLWRIK